MDSLTSSQSSAEQLFISQGALSHREACRLISYSCAKCHQCPINLLHLASNQLWDPFSSTYISEVRVCCYTMFDQVLAILLCYISDLNMSKSAHSETGEILQHS